MSNLVVAVLGAEGFIGSHVVKSCLNAKIPIHELQKWDGNRESLKYQLQELKLADPDSQIVLIQAAWYSTDNTDYRTSPENTRWTVLTKSILDICKENDIIFAGLGTCLEKLDNYDDVYTSSKSEIHRYISQKSPYMDWIWFQIHYVYSTEYLKPAVMRKALDALTNGKVLSLKTPNDVHDFVEVRDAADAIVHSLVNSQRGTIEIGTGRTIKVSKLLKSLFPNLKISEEDSTENRISYQGAASVERLVKSGWIPKFSIH